MANYLYNGVELPELPEWDKETYPYAYIGNHGGSIYFVVHAQPLVYNLDLDRAENPKQHQQVTWWYANGAWPSDGTVGTSAGAGKMAIPSHPFWCNTDMLVKGTSTVYLAASEPAPVLSIDHNAMVQGWIVGKRLAAMRSKKLPGDITDATFENGVLYIKNASAVLNGSILEVK